MAAAVALIRSKLGIDSTVYTFNHYEEEEVKEKANLKVQQW